MVDVDAAAVMEPEALLSLLQRDPDALEMNAKLLITLRGKMATVDGKAQYAWHTLLNTIAASEIHSGRDDTLLVPLAVLAAEMNLWRNSARLFFKVLQGGPARQSQGDLLFNLGIAYMHCGAHRAAARYLQRAAVVRPTRAKDCVAHARLLQFNIFSSRCHALLGSHSIRPKSPCAAQTASSPVLRATLLGMHHALALWRLQRDGELASLAGVECISSIDHAKHWISDASTRDTVLAIMHPVYGLIGVVALLTPPQAAISSDEAARFYFWIGSDFQGQGFGTQAFALLQIVAQRKGIRHLFSTVHVDNIGSRRVLEKSGGRALAFAITGAAQDHSFFYIGTDMDDKVLHATLSALLDNSTAPEQLAPYGGRPDDMHVGSVC